MYNNCTVKNGGEIMAQLLLRNHKKVKVVETSAEIAEQKRTNDHFFVLHEFPNKRIMIPRNDLLTIADTEVLIDDHGINQLKV